MVDSHCHLADDVYEADLEDVVSRAVAAGVSGALCVVSAGDERELTRAGRVAAVWPAVRFAAGIHPHTSGAFADDAAVDAAILAAVAAVPGLAAIGEIGLDYHYAFSPKDRQRAVFRRQLGLARERGMPVVIHAREADAETLEILREPGGRPLSGVLHCFSGDEALLEAGLELGLHVSFAGMVTFPKADALRRLAARVPAGRLLVETDCPYLAPVPHRGRRNEPAWVVATAAALAAARGESVESFEADTTANFTRLFGRMALFAR